MSKKRSRSQNNGVVDLEAGRPLAVHPAIQDITGLPVVTNLLDLKQLQPLAGASVNGFAVTRWPAGPQETVYFVDKTGEKLAFISRADGHLKLTTEGGKRFGMAAPQAPVQVRLADRQPMAACATTGSVASWTPPPPAPTVAPEVRELCARLAVAAIAAGITGVQLDAELGAALRAAAANRS